MRWFRLFLVVVALLGAHPQRAASEPDPGLEEVRQLNREGHHGRAVERARGLLASADADSLRIAGILDVLVESLWQGGKAGTPETVELARRALAIREQRWGADHLETAAARTSLGIVHFERNEFDAALDTLQRALAILQRELPDDDPRLARALTPLGNSLRRKARYAEARPLLERALAIREKTLGPEHPDVASALFNLGTLFGDLGEYAETRRLFERGVAIRERALGPDHPQVAAGLDNLGLVLRVLADYPAARAAHERGLAIRERTLAPDDPAIANSCQNLALVYRAQGHYREARALFERAIAVREKALGIKNPEYARAINNLASLLRDTGDYAAARSLYERALALREGADHPDLANTLRNLGMLLEHVGDHEGARRHYERSLTVSERLYGPKHPFVGFAQRLLGGALERQGDLAGARQRYETALATLTEKLGPDADEVGSVHVDLCGVIVAMGDAAGARPSCERGLALHERVKGPDHVWIADDLRALARVQLAEDSAGAARASLARAYQIREKAIGPEDARTATSLYQLARVDAALGDHAGALERALEAERRGRAHVRLTARGLAEREALRYETTREPSLDLAITLAVRGAEAAAPRRVLDELVRTRAVVLDEMAARHRAARGSPDTIVVARAARLAAARERYAGLLVREALGGAATSAATREEARTTLEAAERALAEVSAGFARELNRSALGLDEVAASLPAGSALVSFAHHRRLDLGAPRPAFAMNPIADTSGFEAYVAFVLRAGERDPVLVDLGAAAEIETSINRWMKTVADPGPQGGQARAEAVARTTGAAVRRKIWDPLVPALAGASRVFLVPDGALHRVSYAALPAEPAGYRVEHGPLLHVVSAERDLVPLDSSEAGVGLLTVGAVDYDAPPHGTVASSRAESQTTSAVRRGFQPCGEVGTVRFEALPATGAESRAVVRSWSAGRHAERVTELRGAEATEAALERVAPGRRVLHLATHGFFLGACEAKAQGARGLGGLAPATATSVSAPREASPLRLSGLVLAGANARSAAPAEDDGILTVEEIASMRLDGAEWVVLSACETARGDVLAGEGVFGLRRGFQVAGARTLIMSLWSVDDDATRAWMKELYAARLERGLDTAESIRAASRAVLERRRAARASTHPFYWAAFIAAGDWR
jgi:CHAT domain-containing protein/Tfp pilus assembly protein PilF